MVFFLNEQSNLPQIFISFDSILAPISVYFIKTNNKCNKHMEIGLFMSETQKVPSAVKTCITQFFPVSAQTAQSSSAFLSKLTYFE